MLLAKFYDAVELRRREKIVIARFLEPHLVISTCRAAGGIRSDLEHIFNHQVCEPEAHHPGAEDPGWDDPLEYRRRVCRRWDLPPQTCATLGTAANMNNIGIQVERFRWLEVAAVVSAGVEGNAGRAGDPAVVFEDNGRFLDLSGEGHPGPGTINIMLFISHPLTPGALVRSLVTATEAKTAVLQELNINSRYSHGLATGTGTDQIAVACRRDEAIPLTGAGKHCKLGELLARAVMGALRETLARQNRLTPAGQCSLRIHLERFGGSRERLLQGMCAHLDQETAARARHNFKALDRDPLAVAAAAALAHLQDKLNWGLLPAQCRPEIMGAYAAQLAAAVSGKYRYLERYRRELAPAPSQADDQALVELVCRALAAGYRDKWREQG